MNLYESMCSALSSVVGHKMRSLLTMLGIIIGISSVIMVSAMGNGVRDSVFDELSDIDTSLIEIYARNVDSIDDLMNSEDLEAIRKVDNVKSAIPLSYWYGINVELRNPNETRTGPIFGTDQYYRDLEKVNISYGRFLTESDVESGALVAIISETTALEVFAKRDAVGETLRLITWNGREELTVVGVYKLAEGSMGVVNSPMRQAICMVPYTAFKTVFGQLYIDSIDVTLIDRSKSDITSNQLTSLLHSRHGNQDKYQAYSLENAADQVDEMISLITLFVSFVAAISLVVGGIGVMNIMLVSVTERTREIGIRKSLGATNGNIHVQFLTESIILTSIGGLIGMVSGFATTRLAGYLVVSFTGFNYNPSVSSPVIIASVGISCAIGIVFGVYPAAKAARLDPVDALRYE